MMPVATFGSKALTAVAPTTTATQILAANSTRVSALLVNNGSVTVYLGVSAAVTVATGIPLPVGASLEDTETPDAWWGITANGTGDIRVCEVF